MTIASLRETQLFPPPTPAALAAERIARSLRQSEESEISELHWHRSLLAPLQDFLNRPGKQLRGALVLSSWTLAGGEAKRMPPMLPLVLELLHAGSLIVDDIQDGAKTRRGQRALHQVYGMPVALNVGNWLYFAASALIDDIELPTATKLELLRCVRRAVLRCHQGQGLDLTARVSTLSPDEIAAVVSATTTLKTVSLVELAAVLGARAAGGTEHHIEALASFARELGTVLQIFDDLSGLLCDERREKGDEDLREGRPTWVWAVAAEQLPRATLVQLQQMSGAVEAGRPVTALRQHLRYALPSDARRHASERLRRAYQEMVERLGPSPALHAMAKEIDRLEKSYV